MKDLDEELWKLGILAKTKHNEVAPAQHELAPIFTTGNIATDHNQLTMEVMKKVEMCIRDSIMHNGHALSSNTMALLGHPFTQAGSPCAFLVHLSLIHIYPQS